MTSGYNIWMICLKLNLFFYDPSPILQLILNLYESRYISSDQKRLFLRTLPLMDTSARCCQSGISFWINFFFFFKCRIFLAYVTPEIPLGSLKKFSTFGPSIWPAIADIYIYIYMSEELSYGVMYVKSRFLYLKYPCPDKNL